MPKIVDHETYRLEIIRQAVQVFVAYGYEGLGMRDLAKHLSVSKSALYHYFPSKEALFQGVVETIVQSDITQLGLKADHNAPFKAKLASFIEHIITHEDWYVQQFLILTDYTRVRDNAISEGTAQMQSATNQYVAAISTFLGITTNEGWAVYLQMNGTIIQRLFDGKQTDLHTAMAWIIESLTAKYG